MSEAQKVAKLELPQSDSSSEFTDVLGEDLEMTSQVNQLEILVEQTLAEAGVSTKCPTQHTLSGKLDRLTELVNSLTQHLHKLQSQTQAPLEFQDYLNKPCRRNDAVTKLFTAAGEGVHFDQDEIIQLKSVVLSLLAASEAEQLCQAIYELEERVATYGALLHRYREKYRLLTLNTSC